MTCTSESVFWLRSTAVRAANRASLDPSVARRILVGKMLISPPSLGAVCAKRMMSSGRAPRIIEEGSFGIKPGANFRELRQNELRRIHLLGNSVNRDKA